MPDQPDQAELTRICPGNQNGSHDRAIHYRPLSEQVIVTTAGIDQLARQLRLMVKAGSRPLVVIHEPTYQEAVRYAPIGESAGGDYAI